MRRISKRRASAPTASVLALERVLRSLQINPTALPPVVEQDEIR
jgi:hypothetical protein